MKGSCPKQVVFTCAILLIFIVAQENRVAAEEPCDPMQLSPCLDTIQKGSYPSNLCCKKVREQKHCVCQYLRNPNFKSFLNSPNAKKIATECDCPYPKC
ncbi:hypothetical protein CARUB_v10021448mg [Capsella rubella]|uniref:Uncharacterized protein n=1 Tax=Capsella rubella TaxID=81985 RepID=R0IBF8_9BRAS|nr:non-specific lipid-transfer protein 2 [Capsella rubella]EOA33953.1 hypothetical protein CARUB_v10021448mg [Capsella rubella]